MDPAAAQTNPRRLRPIFKALSLVALGILVSGIHVLRTVSSEHFMGTQRYEDLYYLPNANWLKVMSLGHREALADLIWMNALVYFGEEFSHKGDVRHVFRYGDAILGLDPDFKRAYRWIGTASLYTPKGATIEDMQRAIEVLESGVRRFPDDGELAWEAGATIAYELMPHLKKDDPRRPMLEERANDYMLTAARYGKGPAWLALTNVTKLKELGKVDRAVRHLEEMYATVRDAKVREQIERQLMRLRSEAHTKALSQALEEFETRRQNDYPYMKPGLYLFVGPKEI